MPSRSAITSPLSMDRTSCSLSMLYVERSCRAWHSSCKRKSSAMLRRNYGRGCATANRRRELNTTRGVTRLSHSVTRVLRKLAFDRQGPRIAMSSCKPRRPLQVYRIKYSIPLPCYVVDHSQTSSQNSPEICDIENKTYNYGAALLWQPMLLQLLQ